MFKFKREVILPEFLKRRIAVKKLAEQAGVGSDVLDRAIKGLPIRSAAVYAICEALRLDPLEVLSLSQEVEIR